MLKRICRTNGAGSITVWAPYTLALSLVLLLPFAPQKSRADGYPTKVPEAQSLEKASALPAPAFYTAPQTLAQGKPGELLAHEVFTGYKLPAGARASRILYQSLDAEGHAVASSAFVIVPAGSPPTGGWPVIAWAHGTSGVARQCAPSLMNDLYYGDLGVYDMIRAGYAIVAPDYHGLGTPGQHQYLSKLAQGRDLIYSVPAARKAVPALGKRWVADGHSQGGMTTWSVAEIESQMHDASYLGAVSVSGAGKLEELPDHFGNTPGVGFYLAFIPYGIHARFPEFAVKDMLTPAAMSRYAAATDKGCWYNGFALFSDLKSGDILKKDWNKNPWAQRFFKENALGTVAVTGPLFVIAGEADQSVPIEGVRDTVAKTCRAGSSQLSFRSYPGLDHTPSMVNSVKDQLAWIADRFSGKPAPSNCPS
jgi:pimeloyl-ACP methyl ester carboxylesterase